MPPAPRTLPCLSRLLNRSKPSPLVQTSFRSLSSSSPSLRSYRRFGDPPPEPNRPRDDLNARANANGPVNPWDIIKSLPTSSGRNSRGSPFGQMKYRATTLLKQPLVLLLLGGGGTYYIIHLEQVPETGRWRFMDVSAGTEAEMAQQSYQEIMQEYGGKLLGDRDPTTKYVRRIVERIVKANDLRAGSDETTDGWEVFVVKDDQTQNAFVIPGGKIFVFTGIIPIAKDEDGLAVILGHEIAHQVARHSAERLSSMKVLVALSYLLTTLGLDLGLSRVLLNVGMTLPNSRKNESEADLIGLRLANNACFNPLAAESLWQRMDEVAGGGGGSLDFLSTHPSSSNRVVKVREWAEEVLKERPDRCGSVRKEIGGFQSSSGISWR
ncbi:hypothetical protein JCM5353_002146 [Sporobolomyces roseus]